MTTYSVGYLVGSLAKASINRKLALKRLAPEPLELTEIPFAELPLYSYDYDADYPARARRFKEAIIAADAVLFVTPSTIDRSPVLSRTRSTGPVVLTERTPSPGSRRP